jgi:hypothetical protein
MLNMFVRSVIEMQEFVNHKSFEKYDLYLKLTNFALYYLQVNRTSCRQFSFIFKILLLFYQHEQIMIKNHNYNKKI